MFPMIEPQIAWTALHSLPLDQIVNSLSVLSAPLGSPLVRTSDFSKLLVCIIHQLFPSSLVGLKAAQWLGILLLWWNALRLDLIHSMTVVKYIVGQL